MDPSTKFQSLNADTKKDKLSVLEKYAKEHRNHLYRCFARKHLEMSVSKRAETPAAADKLIKYLKTVYNWAITQDLAAKNPAVRIKKINKSDGH